MDLYYLSVQLTCDKSSLLHQTTDYTKSIVQGTLCLFQHEFVASSDKSGDCAARVLDSSDLEAEKEDFYLIKRVIIIYFYRDA